MLAEAFHVEGRALNDGMCVCEGCENPAGRWAHHLVEKSWLRLNGLERHMWDWANACPICDGCHERHTNGSRPIGRADLVAAGIWRSVVEWAEAMDRRVAKGPGHRPVSSRLERTYPELVVA